MGVIKKQGISTTLIIVIGFLLGAINTYFFTNKNYFSPHQFAFFQQLFPALNILLFTIGALSVPYITKFHPYYDKDNNKTDLFFVSVLITLIGAFIILLFYFIAKPLLFYFYKGSSISITIFIDYFFISGFGYLIFNLFESFSIIHKNTIAPSFFKEIFVRMIIFILIVLFIYNIFDFETVIKIFAFTYFIAAFILGVYVIKKYKIKCNTTISQTTKSNFKKIFAYSFPIYLGQIMIQFLIHFDTLLITQLLSLNDLALFVFALYLGAILIIPQRSLANITTTFFSQYWKDNNLIAIDELYKKTANTLFYFSLFIFGNILLNFDNMIHLLNLNPHYFSAKIIFIFVAIKYIIDLATGFNNYILNLSPKWAYEFWGVIITMLFFVPIHYFVCKQYGLQGLVIMGVFNLLTINIFRLFVLYHHYKIHPFNKKMILQLVIAIASFVITYFILKTINVSMVWGIILKVFLFSFLFILINYLLNTSLQINQFINKIILSKK